LKKIVKYFIKINENAKFRKCKILQIYKSRFGLFGSRAEKIKARLGPRVCISIIQFNLLDLECLVQTNSAQSWQLLENFNVSYCIHLYCIHSLMWQLRSIKTVLEYDAIKEKYTPFFLVKIDYFKLIFIIIVELCS
jgi:hypothetical protein